LKPSEVSILTCWRGRKKTWQDW